MELNKENEIFKIENFRFVESMKVKYSTKENTERLEHDIRQKMQFVSDEI